MPNDRQPSDYDETQSQVANTQQPGIDYTVDFIYGSDQDQYLEREDEQSTLS
ncbi:hypothetical protein [Paenibacillus flagellatus]|uniref:hypothetical protein n=1 Tax=Paenibacillus flagellatus TaxID=2211139 RepID=UPI001305436D|nr:hypothetical protein [Paenibacillus flagellatus]